MATLSRPGFRLSATRRPLCPRRWQHEVLLGNESEGGDYAEMGKIGHRINGLYIDYLSEKRTDFDIGYFNHLTMKHIPADFPAWMREDLDDVLERFSWNFRLDLRADTHITEVNLAYDRDRKPCDPDDHGIDRVTFQPDYVRVYDGGTRAAIDDWKLGYQLFDYMDLMPRYDSKFPPSKACIQLAFYARGWMIIHPECQECVVSVHGCRWGKNNMATFDWTREKVAEFVDPIVDDHFGELDHYWHEHGTDDYPTDPHWSVCRYCDLALNCPDPRQTEILFSQENAIAAAKGKESRAKKVNKLVEALSKEERKRLSLILTHNQEEVNAQP